MDVNQHDRPKNNPVASGIKLWVPPKHREKLDSLHPDRLQEKLDNLHSNQLKETIKRLKEDRDYKVIEEYSGDTPEQLSKLSRERPPKKTLWDWSQLLIIPLLIAGLGIGLPLAQNLTSIQIAQDQQQETILKTYLDDMSDLLLKHTPNLRTSNPGDEIRQVARERTLTTLRRLDGRRNKIVLRYLQDAHLIGMQDAVINLSHADLSNDELSGIDLSGIDLNGANLNGAHLHSADLYDANLIGATLGDADLSDAHLGDALLTNASLNGANLNDAKLNGAKLNGADLSDAHLSDALLTNANLNGANLNGALQLQILVSTLP